MTFNKRMKKIKALCAKVYPDKLRTKLLQELHYFDLQMDATDDDISAARDTLMFIQQRFFCEGGENESTDFPF